MKKLVKWWILFVCGWFIELLFLWWAWALNFIIQNDSNSWKNTVLDYNIFSNYNYTTNRYISLDIWSKNSKFTNFWFVDLPFSWSTYPFSAYTFASNSTNTTTDWLAFRETFNNYSTYSIISTWIVKTWTINSFWIPKFYVWNYWQDLGRFALVASYDSWQNVDIGYPWYSYQINDSQRVWFSFWWNEISNLEKTDILDFTSYRFFRQGEDLLSGWKQNDYISTPFRADYFQKFTYDRTSYVYRYNNLTYDKNFYDSWKKGLVWLWYWNSYSFASDLWDSSDNLMSFDEFYLWGRSDIVITPNNLNSLHSFSGWRFEHIAILNPFWFNQESNDLIWQTVLIWKSRDYPNRIRVDVVDCSATTIEKINDELQCPLIKRWYLKPLWVYMNWVKVENISLYNSSEYDILPFDTTNWSYNFAGQYSFLAFLWWQYSNSHLSHFNLDWNTVSFISYNNSTYVYEYRFTIVEDQFINTTLWQQAEQWVLGTFVPLFSWWELQTWQYVLPWQPWFIISGWVSVVDPNWTWFVENNLTWWFRAFYCPYDYGFVSLKLSDIPWLSLLAWSSIDFDLLKPISCMFSSFWQWVEEMKNNTFPSISFLSWWLVNQTWLMYSASSDSKNLFGVILDLILGALGVYLFIKRIK